MAVNIVTGRTGEAHITSDDEKMRNVEMFGGGEFVFNVGGKLKAEKQDSTHVTVYSGMCMKHGVQMGVEAGTTETLTLDAGSIGYKRHDLIVMHYERDDNEDVESAELIVKKGQVSASTPEDPAIIDGDPLDGADEMEMALWRCVFDGTDLSLEPMFSYRNGYKPDPENPDQEIPDEENSYVITADVIDRLWGSGLVDGDGLAW